MTHESGNSKWVRPQHCRTRHTVSGGGSILLSSHDIHTLKHTPHYQVHVLPRAIDVIDICCLVDVTIFKLYTFKMIRRRHFGWFCSARLKTKKRNQRIFWFIFHQLGDKSDEHFGAQWCPGRSVWIRFVFLSFNQLITSLTSSLKLLMQRCFTLRFTGDCCSSVWS